MMLVFLHLYFAPWRRFRAAVARRDTPEAARQLNQIRWIVTVNLVLGLADCRRGQQRSLLGVRRAACCSVSTPGSIGFNDPVIEVLPSAEIQTAERPPSWRGRNCSVLLPGSWKTKPSSVMRPLRRLQMASCLLSMLGPIE